MVISALELINELIYLLSDTWLFAIKHVSVMRIDLKPTTHQQVFISLDSDSVLKIGILNNICYIPSHESG